MEKETPSRLDFYFPRDGHVGQASVFDILCGGITVTVTVL